jgi:hypothetical protein
VDELLYETADRDESHRMLEKILAEGKHPRAECREDANAEKPYQVWSDKAPYVERPAPAAAAPGGVDLDELAGRIASKLRGGA